MIIELNLGDVVIASYKTGTYFGEIVGFSPSQKYEVSVIAVKKHPSQGDLHHSMSANVSFFHQRRALANGEIALIAVESIKKYHGDLNQIPLYQESLEQSWKQEMEQMKQLLSQPQTHAWATRCIEQLHFLGEEYGFQSFL
jgi:kinase-associated protein B